MAQPPLAASPNLFDFFHEHVDCAVSAKGRPVSEEGVYYLSNLLVEQGRSPAQAEPSTLVELQIEAAGSNTVRLVQCLRTMGDKALYTLGFFRNHIRSRNLSPTYYRDMGATAYGRLSRLLSGPRGGAQEGHKSLDVIFAELSSQFDACADVLREVREEIRADGSREDDQAILALYEEWLATGNAAAAERLRQCGVLLIAPGGDPRPC